MLRLLPGLLLATALLLPPAAEGTSRVLTRVPGAATTSASAVSADKPPPEPEGPPQARAPVVKLGVQPGAKQPRALRYQLLPDRLDLTPGNAAPLWVRAGQAATDTRHALTDKEYSWGSADDTPLKDLPRREVRALLEQYAAALRLAEQAARRERCDWEFPPPTFQTMQDLPLHEVQVCRQVAFLLSLQCRLELSEGQFDKAVYTLQTGFVLARHIGDTDTLVQNLVGNAIAGIMLGRVEEMIQLPGSPNLYWSLTTLPSPFIDVRRSMNVELNTLYRSFPALRKLELDRGAMAPADLERLVEDLFREAGKACGVPFPEWQGKVALAGITLKVYPDAKQYLLAQGRTPEQVEAMPALQVVLLFYLDQYNQVRDDVLKWLSVPPWQAVAGLEQVQKAVQNSRQNNNPLVALLLPACSKVHLACLRTDRHIAGLRCAEALRLHAVAHDGRAPDKLGDVTAVPPPVDPFTGKGFDAFYQASDGKGVLNVPPPPGQGAALGRRYERGR
jgi:hypothetical protein